MATKNEIYLEWTILYKKVQTKRERDKIIKELLDSISGKVKTDGESIPLICEVFKSESNKRRYILKVYKVSEAAKSSGGATSRKAMAMPVVDELSEPIDGAMSFSGPVRPSGPPSQIPPGILSIS